MEVGFLGDNLRGFFDDENIPRENLANGALPSQGSFGIKLNLQRHVGFTFSSGEGGMLQRIDMQLLDCCQNDWGEATTIGLCKNKHTKRTESTKKNPGRKTNKIQNYTSIDPKQPFSHSHKLDYFDFKSCPGQKYGEDKQTSIQISELESMTTQDPVEGRQRETNLEIIMKLNPVDGRQRETRVETSLEIMRELDPVKGRQRETHIEKSLEIASKLHETGSTRRDTHGEKPGNHDEAGSNRRETKGDKPGKHDETRSSKR